MEKRKVLYISQEIKPYLPDSEISIMSRELPQGIQEKGREIRTFMPRFGSVNERRNQLHEVIRLSGMNLIINDTDHLLVIKVASIQSARMQVYFIDNEDYFHRKSTICDENGNEYKDNDERCVFFARGVLETVKKLRWTPDIIHCHGWMTSLIPLYIKKAYNDEPFFENSKVIYSLYNDDFKSTFPENYYEKILLKGIDKNEIASMGVPNFTGISKLAINYSDAVIQGSPEVNSEVTKFIKNKNLPLLNYCGDEFINEYDKFYDTLFE